jgi:hypothetical protein
LMGLFSKSKDDSAPSYSREWISRHGPGSRKNMLAIAAQARITQIPSSSATAFGHPLDDAALADARAVLEGVMRQDRSLARHVTRDLALVFESMGGLYVHQHAAMQAAGAADGRLSPAGASALAIARTIQARNNGTQTDAPDTALYIRHFEDTSPGAHEQAISAGAWVATVTARLKNQGTIDGDGIPFFQPGAVHVGEMWAPGYYPNPVNAGDTSSGDASIERWWDGQDWTPRVRVREGRRWLPEQQFTLFQVPSN